MGDHEPWIIEINERYLFNRPGEGARKIEQQHAAGKSTLRRTFERLVDAKTDERNWRRGAEGEEEVGRRLAQLPRPEWAVVHDLTIGRRGANLDHLVIGPPGIFALNTKHLTGNVTVYERALLQNGHKTTYVRDSLREARTVQRRLSFAPGREVKAWGVIVLMGCEADWKQRPVNCSVVGRRDLPNWFLRMPRRVLTPGDVIELEQVARTPSTWLPNEKPSGSSGKSRPRPAAPEAKETEGGEAAFVVNRWRKFGHDRLYANLPNGSKVGWIDVATGEVTIEDPAYASRIRVALVEARAALG